ncbi:MAG TPA: YqgE/AlgH family protein [Burkholderiales bacterium]|nr:YqgE/AlgH family protein [Burkholderiales bacterium]
MKTTWVTGFAVGALLASAGFAARAQNVDRPMLLVASPGTTGFYSQAVLVVVPKAAGHVGFMINRATRTTVASAFPDEAEIAKVADPIFLGGPRGRQSMYAVVRRDPGEGSRQLFDDVFVTVSGKTVDRLLRESPREARYFAGYAGWEAGELAEEIQQGDWLLVEPDAAVLFNPNPEAIWPELVKRMHRSF